MNDNLKRLHCPELKIRAYTTLTQHISNELCSIHQTTPNATYALSQALTATALLSASLKPESNQSLAYRIDGKGPLKSLYVQADNRGGMRGYPGVPDVDHKAEFDAINFSQAIGAGTLTITKELGMKEPYTGISALLYGSIARDTAYYLTTSEQIPSAMIIACETSTEGTVTAAGGILIQTFPDTKEEVIETIEKGIEEVDTSLGSFLNEGKDILLYLSNILDHAPIELLSELPLRHSCSCSKDLISNSLSYVSTEDLNAMIAEDKGAEITCTFCKSVYPFSEQDLQEILDKRH